MIRSDLRWNRLPILFLSAHTDAETMHRGFAARANDFLSKPVDEVTLLTRIQSRLEQRKLWDMADIDESNHYSRRVKDENDK